MNDLTGLAQIAGALLRSVAPAERRTLLRTMARGLQKSQSARIARQQAPDGSAYPARKVRPVAPERSRLRRGGAIRRGAMFRKIRLSRNLKADATDQEAWVGFVGRAARIAGVHQDGGMDRPGPGQPVVPYARRVLLGVTPPEEGAMLDILLAHVTAAV